MQQQEIRDFLIRFFTANGCEIMIDTPAYFTVQLTIEMDKELMNRPFYWHYLEKTGGVPNPMSVSFIFDQRQAPASLKGEIIHFGSPRLHQIFRATRKLASSIRLFEQSLSAGGQTALRPWLGLNVKISYQCDRKRDEFRSIGLQLINGTMVERFHDQLLTLNLTRKIPDYSFTLSPLIMPKSGITRIANLLRNEVLQKDDTWAHEARQRWAKDLSLLEHFYEDLEEKGETYENEKLALKEQYEPKVQISIVNGGLFYLTEQAI